MGNYPMPYVLITPARNEEAFIEKTLQSMVKQTILPAKWVIVNDGSTDATSSIVRPYLADHQWIELIDLPVRKERNFAAKVYAFNAGQFTTPSRTNAAYTVTNYYGIAGQRLETIPHPSKTVLVAEIPAFSTRAPNRIARAAPMTRARGSANSTGPQSAVATPMARPGSRVTMPSAGGRESLVQGVIATTTSGEWTW